MSTQKYTISQMSDISNISKKALRFYDDLKLISPKRHGANNYRFYTHDDLLSVPPLKYYKQMGFNLSEIRAAFDVGSNTTLSALRKMFMEKIDTLQLEEKMLHLRLTSVKDWLELLYEAEVVLENSLQSVAAKYIQPERLLFYEQTFTQDIKTAIINPDFTNYVESIQNSITGPVTIRFSSLENRLANTEQHMTILQRTVFPCDTTLTMEYGGFLVASCYHIGAHASIADTYRKLQRWCKSNNYICAEDAFERYITDFWTTNNEALFVTEVLVRIGRAGHLVRHSPPAFSKNTEPVAPEMPLALLDDE